MRRNVFFLLTLVGGCSPEKISIPESSLSSITRMSVPRPHPPIPIPLFPDTSIRGAPVATYAELFREATVVVPSQTKMPMDLSGYEDYVHPDIMMGGQRGCATKRQIATPYKNSNPNFENPTFFCLNSKGWFSPLFMKNPLVPHPGPTRYNSDPDMFYDEALGETIITWREVDPSFNTIKALTTIDEVNIFQRGILFQERNHNAVSQTSVLESDRSLWSMWYIESGGGGCTSSSTRVILREAVPLPGVSVTAVPLKVVGPVNISQPGYVIWHIDVIQVEDVGYIMLAAAYPKDTDCGHNDLFLFVSQDRKNWENFNIPFLWRTMPPFNVKTLYRGSLLFDPRNRSLGVTLSAMSLFGDWRVWENGEYKLDLLLSALRRAKSTDMPVISASRIGIDIPHELEKKPFIAP